MPVPFVLVEPDAVEGTRARLSDDSVHHLRRVLRVDPGDPVEVSDGAGRVWPGILGDAGEIALTSDAQTMPEPTPRLHVIQALPKGRKFDDIVQVLVEVGVTSITPVTSGRSVVRLDPDARARAQRRWAAVARAAASQARRAWAPTVAAVTSLDDAIAAEGDGVVLHPEAPVRLRDVIASMGAPTDIVLAVGPEGGWSDDEVAACAAAGLAPATLGPSVLRTEHAAFAACAALQFVLGSA